MAGAFVAHSQGTVAFGNYLNATYTYVSLKSGSTTTPIGGAASAGPAGPSAAADVGNGNEWTVALYGAAGTGDASSTLVQVDQASAAPVTATMAEGTGAATPDGVAGTWASSEIGVIPGTTGGGSATVQVYAWYNDGGTLTSYAAAKAAGVPTGFSGTANVTSLGGPTSGTPAVPAALPTGASGIGSSFSVTSTVPEPSTIALGVMGATEE